MLHPERSIRPRKKPSRPAVSFALHGPITDKKPDASVLDWGCGHGVDVDWFNEMKLFARGYDPHAPCDGRNLGRNLTWIPNSWRFDYITCFYVLNVITPKKERAKCLIKAAKYLKPDGKMFIAVRSKSKIKYSSKNWRKYRDGFITKKSTFQRGFTDEELKGLVEKAGLCYTRWSKNGFIGCVATRP